MAPASLVGEDLASTIALVGDGLVQVVTEADYPNPYIRPWPSRRPVGDQQADLQDLATGTGWGACLYPTPAAMEGRLGPADFLDEPYRRRMAEGNGHLELAYFTLDVLEHYRNDPRYHFEFSDFEVTFGIGDDAYLDEGEPVRDKIASVRAGFAYDKDALIRDEVRRFVCTFNTDLADPTPEHQRRWETYEQRPIDDLAPHPIWWTMMMGNWPDGIGPFDLILEEMGAINELFELIHGQPLFAVTDRPREWGWVLRASSAAWEEFIHTTDKLLSDNIRSDALDAAGAPTRNRAGDALGTIGRIQEYLVQVAHVPVEDARAALAPIRHVRAERQRPAHTLAAPRTDATTTARQRDLLSELRGSLASLRSLLATHPSAAGWVLPDALAGPSYRL